MRIIDNRISQWNCGRYFFFWEGDEILMKATNDADAIAEGKRLMSELSQG